MRRKFNLVLQSKGGVGKSFFTYLAGLSQANGESFFVDVDNFNQSSSRQLKFLGEDRVEKLSLMDSRDVLVRDIFIGYLESLAESELETIFMDFGAGESDQFPVLISRDIDFKQWCDVLDFDMTFHVIMAAGTEYGPCGAYLEKLVDAGAGKFRVIAWENMHSFRLVPELSVELELICEKLGIELRRFGDFDSTTLLGKQILKGVRSGYNLGSYPPGAKISITTELKDNFKPWQ